MTGVVGVLWQVIAPIFLAAGLGYLLARTAGLEPRHLSRVVFFLLSPCLLFDKLSHTALSAADLGRLAAFTVLTIAGAGLVGWLICRLRGFDQVQTSAFILVVIAGNVGNYGLPANQFAFGPDALEPAIVYYGISTLLLSTAGVFLAARGRRSARDALLNMLRVPLAYAGLAGVLVWATGLAIPMPIERAAALLGAGAVPVMLVLLGVQLAGVRLRSDLGRIGLASATRLLVAPLLGLGLAGAVGLSGLARNAALLESAMPTAVMTTVLATEYDAQPPFVAGVVLVSTLGSIITVSLLLSFLIGS